MTSEEKYTKSGEKVIRFQTFLQSSEKYVCVREKRGIVVNIEVKLDKIHDQICLNASLQAISDNLVPFPFHLEAAL